jgi:two-component system, OmpR family, osmolarity sensor histidine kinase EnvZ
MLSRLGLAGRLLAMVLFFLLAVVAVGSSIAYIGSGGGEADFRQSLLPEQSAAIAKLLDRADAAEMNDILRAVNTAGLQVVVTPQQPDHAATSLRLSRVERLVGRHFDPPENRTIIATLINPSQGRFPRLARAFAYVRGDQLMRIEISLRSGRFAVLETRGALISRIYGMPIGFFIGFIGSLVGIATIWAIMREARPLKQLVASVDQFAKNAVPSPVDPSGAPEIKRLVQANNDMQARIANLIAGRSLFLGAISHDLKTFLTRFRLRLEEIQDDENRQRGARDLDDMTHLLDDALMVAAGANAPTRKTEIDLSELLKTDLADRPASRVKMDILPKSGEFLVSGDPVALRRMFGNVINNALTYGQHCIVTLTSEADWRMIDVADDGPGIPEEERKLVFEPFYRIDRSRSRQTGGSGLGLAIARQIVEAHNGTIEIQPSPLGGTLIRVRLPQAKASPKPGA